MKQYIRSKIICTFEAIVILLTICFVVQKECINKATTATVENESLAKVLDKEIDSYDFNKYNVTTIYIGGGTPSYVESKYICVMLNKIKLKLEKSDSLPHQNHRQTQY